MPTGEIEVSVESVVVQSEAETLPLQVVADSDDLSEEQRLTYRFLDLRREKPHANILLRNRMTKFVRDRMWDMGFYEFQTPILTSSSPEGARDYLVPSRVHKGEFYALPQSPQQFKQLLMVAGFDRYFQLAPCFRDEDSRADRSPGEFYQIDFEMSFVTQDEIFEVGERLMSDLFAEFAPNANISKAPFIHIPFAESMLTYGTDKPDLRNPLVIKDVSDVFAGSSFGLFANMVAQGGFVRAIRTPGTAAKPRSWFDKMNGFAVEQGMGGLGYMTLTEEGTKGPIAKNLDADRIQQLIDITAAQKGDSIFFICGKDDKAVKFAGSVRMLFGKELDLIEKNTAIFKKIIPQVVAHNNHAILLIVANPVDVLTNVALKLSGFPRSRVFGSGTVLDTARLKSILGSELHVDSRNIHTFIVGEHGDSELALWSRTYISGLSIDEYCKQMNIAIDKDKLYQHVRDSAYEIIKRKGVTNYAIAMAVKRIASSIVHDENSVLPISSLVEGQYGIDGVCMGLPTIVGIGGAGKTLELSISEDELKKLKDSAKTLKETFEQTGL